MNSQQRLEELYVLDDALTEEYEQFHSQFQERRSKLNRAILKLKEEMISRD